MDTTRAIGFMAGWKHCASTGSYWYWLIGYTIFAFLVAYAFKWAEKHYNKDLDNAFTMLVIGLSMAWVCFLLVRPANVGADTWVGAALRNHYLGY